MVMWIKRGMDIYLIFSIFRVEVFILSSTILLMSLNLLYQMD